MIDKILKTLKLNINDKTRAYTKYTLTSSLIFLSWIPVIYEFTNHIAYIGKIEGISMKPTFNPDSNKNNNNNSNDYVLIWKFGVRDINNLKYQDIVFLRSPIDPSKIYIKRIKGKQGDFIIPRYPDLRNKVLIPMNHLWVEGDNLHSIDSNTYGPISSSLIIGKAIAIIWPLNRFGWVNENGGRECRENYLKYTNT